MEETRKQTKAYLNSLTREELIEVLEKAGFEVEGGDGEIIFTDKVIISDQLRNKGVFMKKEEYEQFNKVVDEVLLPILEEHKEDIDKILDNNPDFKSEIESKVEAILVKRKNNTNSSFEQNLDVK